MTKQNLRIVVIDCPIENWNHRVVKETFHKMVDLKLSGFRSRMPSNYLPVDASDYIGTHMLVCEEVCGNLTPLTGFKGISADRCLHYGQQFTGRTCISSVQSEIHKSVLNQYIDDALAPGYRLSYIGSYAVAPNTPKRIKAELLRLIFQLIAFYQVNFKLTRLLAIGSTRSRTNITLRKLGFEPLMHQGSTMAPVCIPSLQNEEFEVMRLEKLSEACNASITVYNSLWDNRIEILPNS